MDTEIIQGSIVQFEEEGVVYGGTVVGRSDSHGPGWHINVVHPGIKSETMCVPAENVSLVSKDWQHVSADGTWMPPGDHDMNPIVGTHSKYIQCGICGRRLRPPAIPALPRPEVGDVVPIYAEVLQFTEGVGLKVKLFSKTDEYEAWVVTDHLDPLWNERRRNDEFRGVIEEMVESLSEKLERLPLDTRVATEVRSLIDTGKEILAR